MKQTFLLRSFLLATLLISSATAFAQSWQWATQPSSPATTGALGQRIARDGSGNLFVLTEFAGTGTFAGSTFSSSGGGSDVVLTKQDANGNWLWARHLSGTSADHANGVAVDAAGDVYVSGYFEGGTLTIGTNNHTGSGSTVCTYVAKFSAAGVFSWSKAVSGTAGVYNFDLDLTSSSDVIVAGYFQGTATFGNLAAITSAGNNDVYVARLSGSNGNFTWVTKGGGTDRETCRGVAVDGSDNIFVSGNFRGNTTFGSLPTVTNYGTGSSNDIFVAKLSSAGAWQWLRQGGGAGNDTGQDIATDGSGNAYMTGAFDGTATFGPSTFTNTSGTGTWDIFVAKIDAAGNWMWAKNAGDPAGDDQGYGVDADASGNVYMTGYFGATANFGSTSLTNSGSADIFVAKLSSTGAWQWALKAGSSGYDSGSRVVADGTGYAYITGNYQASSAAFGTINLSASSVGSMIVAKAGMVSNQPPVIAAQSFSLAENSANGTVVGTVAASDPNTGQTLTYSITAGNTSGAFSINASSGQLSVANSAALNYEGTPTFSLTVLVADNASPSLSSSATVTVNLTNVNELTTTGSSTNVSCFGSANGSAAVVASGEPAPYTYSWRNTTTNTTLPQTTASVTGLAPGNYTVTVTSTSTTFTATRSYVITQPTALSATQSQVNVSTYGGANGSASVVASGGTGTYGYSWRNTSTNTSLAQTTATATGLVAGDYSVTITDANNCSLTKTFTITQPAPPLPTLTAISPSAELPGMPVTLTGANLSGATAVTFGGVAGTGLVVNSATSVTVTVPAAAAVGNSTIVITTPNGSSTASPTFAVLAVYTGGAVNSCLAAVPATASINDGQWHYLLSTGGQVVAAYNYTGATLGNLAVDVLRINSGSNVRQDADGRYYLDRNFHLTASAGAFTGRTVLLRLYGPTSEFARLQAADASVTYATLKATQYSGPNEDCTLGNNSRTGERRTLAATGTNPTGTTWFMAQMSVADHFSEFYLTGSPLPLPVELTDFSAVAKGAGVQVAWATASEKNSARFAVERSTEGKEYVTVGTVEAAGNSSTPRAYAHFDRHLPAGAALLYYRLRQTDLDGTISYSPVRTVSRVAPAAAQLLAYPNPAQHAVQVRLVGAAGESLQLLDALGRVVLHQAAPTEGQEATLPLQHLPAGLYVLRCGTLSQRLTIE